MDPAVELCLWPLLVGRVLDCLEEAQFRLGLRPSWAVRQAVGVVEPERPGALVVTVLYSLETLLEAPYMVGGTDRNPAVVGRENLVVADRVEECQEYQEYRECQELLAAVRAGRYCPHLFLVAVTETQPSVDVASLVAVLALALATAAVACCHCPDCLLPVVVQSDPFSTTL